MGHAKKGEQEKTVREEEEGLQKVPPFLLLFFSSALLFTSPSTTYMLEQARDFKGLHLFVESPVGWGIPLSKGAWRRSPAPSGSNLAVAVALVDP